VRPIEVERVLLAEGWVLSRQRGSHRIYHHPSKSGIVVLPWHNRDIPTGTLRNIYRQAGIEYP
jgi:predicted RNA binding protein YcfA (HicA-like mRNA interferase family)